MSEQNTMLPECKVHFDEGARRMNEILTKLDNIDGHIRNGMTSKITRNGTMLTVLWPIVLLILGGLVSVAWKVVGG